MFSFRGWKYSPNRLGLLLCNAFALVSWYIHWWDSLWMKWVCLHFYWLYSTWWGKRSVWRYQKDNQNPQSKEGQTTQRPKRTKGQTMIYKVINEKTFETTKGQSRMENPEPSATLSTQDTGRRQKKPQKLKTREIRSPPENRKYTNVLSKSQQFLSYYSYNHDVLDTTAKQTVHV